MACHSDFIQYIIDQCSEAGEITVKKMMGDYCIYCNGILFGLICDDKLYIKVTDAGKILFDEMVLQSPYPGAKEYFRIDNVDNRMFLSDLIRVTLPILALPKIKKNKT